MISTIDDSESDGSWPNNQLLSDSSEDDEATSDSSEDDEAIPLFVTRRVDPTISPMSTLPQYLHDELDHALELYREDLVVCFTHNFRSYRGDTCKLAKWWGYYKPDQLTSMYVDYRSNNHYDCHSPRYIKSLDLDFIQACAYLDQDEADIDSLLDFIIARTRIVSIASYMCIYWIEACRYWVDEYCEIRVAIPSKYKVVQASIAANHFAYVIKAIHDQEGSHELLGADGSELFLSDRNTVEVRSDNILKQLSPRHNIDVLLSGKSFQGVSASVLRGTGCVTIGEVEVGHVSPNLFSDVDSHGVVRIVSRYDNPRETAVTLLPVGDNLAIVDTSRKDDSVDYTWLLFRPDQQPSQPKPNPKTLYKMCLHKLPIRVVAILEKTFDMPPMEDRSRQLRSEILTHLLDL